MPRTRRTLAAVATGTVALGLGLGVASLASAAPSASPDPSATPSASAPATPEGAPADRPDGGRAGHRGGPGGDRERLAPALAEELDLDVADVRAALREYRQAHRPTARPEPGTRPARPDDTALAKALAESLDVDEGSVTAALESVRSERRAERAQAVADQLDEAVEAGTLTRVEADAVQKAADAGIVHVGR